MDDGTPNVRDVASVLNRVGGPPFLRVAKRITQRVRCWGEAVHFLLTTYVTPLAIRQAVQALMDTRQTAQED